MRGAQSVLAQRHHHDPTVRLAVAQSAEGVAGEPPDPAIVEAVIGLTRDEDDGVRNWATFSLALLFEIDSPAVRDALIERLVDPGRDDVHRGARRACGTRRRARARVVLARLRAAAEDGFAEHAVAELLVEAAELLGDPRFIPALATLREREDDPDWCERLTDAIASCAEPS